MINMKGHPPSSGCCMSYSFRGANCQWSLNRSSCLLKSHSVVYEKELNLRGCFCCCCCCCCLVAFWGEVGDELHTDSEAEAIATSRQLCNSCATVIGLARWSVQNASEWTKVLVYYLCPDHHENFTSSPRRPMADCFWLMLLHTHTDSFVCNQYSFLWFIFQQHNIQR